MTVHKGPSKEQREADRDMNNALARRLRGDKTPIVTLLEEAMAKRQHAKEQRFRQAFGHNYDLAMKV
jgi:hypothetical protein